MNNNLEIVSNQVVQLKTELTDNFLLIENQLPDSINSKLLLSNAINAVECAILAEMKKDGKSRLLDAILINKKNFTNIVLNFVMCDLDMGNKESYILPFGGVLQPVIDRIGVKKLLLKYSSIPIEDIVTCVVKENDEFSFIDDVVIHKFDPFASDKERGLVRGAYAKVILKSGKINYHFVTSETIIKIKSGIAGSDNEKSPWQKWYDKMCEKTVLKSLRVHYPLSFESPRQAQAYSEADEIDWSKENDVPVPVVEKPIKIDGPNRKYFLELVKSNNLDASHLAVKYNLNRDSTEEDFKNACDDLMLELGGEL